MQIKISARHGHLSEATQQYIRDKAQKLLHLFSRLTMIEVTVDLNEEQNVVEFKVSAEHKHDFVGRESAKEVLTAVDLCLAKLEMQLRRYKEKIQDKRRTPSTGAESAQVARGLLGSTASSCSRGEPALLMVNSAREVEVHLPNMMKQ